VPFQHLEISFPCSPKPKVKSQDQVQALSYSFCIEQKDQQRYQQKFSSATWDTTFLTSIYFGALERSKRYYLPVLEILQLGCLFYI
jgi:hypothetical protein